MEQLSPSREAAEIDLATRALILSPLPILKSQGLIPYLASIKDVLSFPFRFLPYTLYTWLCDLNENLLANNLAHDVFNVKCSHDDSWLILWAKL